MIVKNTGVSIILNLRKRGFRNVELAKMLGVSRALISQHVQKLQELGLVDKGREINLTNSGRIIAEQIHLVNHNLDFLKKDPEFWNRHDLTGIPLHLLFRISELECCEVATSDNELFPYISRFFEMISDNDPIKMITCILLPFNFSLKRIDEAIISESLLEKVSNYGRIYLMKNPRIFCLISDNAFCMSLPKLSGELDTKAGLISCDASAVRWGKELFEYLKLNSQSANFSSHP
ncbi:transcriptional regulator FilR1 domain-containing protein [Archaeoglobus sp.]|uniref:helix-turn-helix transcriptional regulator n=1 Tax=Archaeoglobus sp. TaxID=1872626 RepID=UPI0024ABEB5D|nr:transcriptional regulator FilR1 domain-containing protein [Archaeoglobus sp.]MDI3498867.1 hypothetical protein [Archaeoglobus sp.]